MMNPKRPQLAKNPAKMSITLIKQRLKLKASDDEVWRIAQIFNNLPA